MKVTAHARRADGWWAVNVTEVPGVFTQARRLSQVPAMVIDAVRLMLDEPGLDVEVTVSPHVDGDEILAAALEARTVADEAAARASALTREAARALIDSGITVRDAGELLGVSAQRVSQLVA